MFYLINSISSSLIIIFYFCFFSFCYAYGYLWFKNYYLFLKGFIKNNNFHLFTFFAIALNSDSSVIEKIKIQNFLSFIETSYFSSYLDIVFTYFLKFIVLITNFYDNFFELISKFFFLDELWCFLLFNVNWSTFLSLSYQSFFLQYSFTEEFFFFYILKFLPYFVDIYLICLVLVLSIFSCLGKWVLLPEARTYWSVLNSLKFVSVFYFQLIVLQYLVFCYDLRIGPLFFFIKNDTQFGQLDSWTILLRFLTVIFFLIFFYFIGDYVNFSGYLWSFEAILFLLISFEMLYISISTNSLLVILGAIGGVSISTYVLIAFERTYISLEASIKYFLLSALATGIMSFGYILIFHISTSSIFGFLVPLSFNDCANNFFSCNSTSYIAFADSLCRLSEFNLGFDKFNSYFQDFVKIDSSIYLYQIGFFFFFIGFFFKLSLFPCYIWAPDVYEGAPMIVVGFMVVTIKFVIFLVLIRVVFSYSVFDFFFWPFFKIIGLTSIIVGSIGALTQQKLKRFVAFTSINQLGLMLLGLAFDPFNLTGSLFSLLIYITTNLMFFGVLLTTREAKSQRLITYMSDLHNLFISSPKSVIYFTISILSMAGIPPFAGFFSKYFLILPIINSSNGLLFGAFILFFHIVSSFNYLRILRDIWFYDLSKLLPFYSCLSNTNMLWLKILSIFQFFCFFFLDYVILFCNYWRWSLYTVNWL